MDLTHSRTVKVIAILLLLAAIIQPIYTALYMAAPELNRQFLWGVEALIFVLMTAFAGSALVMAKRYTLGFSAIVFSAVLNVMQVGIGLTQFGPFRAAAQANPDLSGLAFSVLAFSFFGYNAAKVLLALAAVVFGMALLGEAKKAQDKGQGKNLSKLIGGAAILTGVIAFFANALVMMLGTKGIVPRPLAGGSGVVATFFLALSLFRLNHED